MTRMTPSEHLAALLDAEAAGHDLDILAFWGHQPEPDGSIGPGCLSQWWLAPFDVDGVRYPTAEHWMMLGKARFFGDAEAAAEVLMAATPREAKAIGRRVRRFDADDWHTAAYDIVVQGNLAKFGQHEELRAFLLGTGTRVIVEASPRDRTWGVGMGPDNPDTQHPSRWRGLNQLGFALMDVRERMRA
jgi:ribA/ribD-fused uncharacterized protein